LLSSLIMGIALVLAAIFHTNLYTATAFGLLAALVFLAEFILKAGWLSRFYRTYLILLIPFVVVNGLLTGTGLAAPVVWYNPAEIIGLRILSIPVEDIFYGMSLILVNVLIYNRIRKNRYRRAKANRAEKVLSGHDFPKKRMPPAVILNSMNK